jgi:ketosteroid isomerase-like protein
MLALLGALGFWLWTVLFPSPEKVVFRMISKLGATANIQAGEGAISRASKAATVSSLFANDAEIAFDVNEAGTRTLSGRDEIHEAVMGGFANVPSLTVQFYDITVQVGPDKQSAEADCNARASTDSNRDFGIRELRFQLKKRDGDWKITRAETVKTLQ